MKYLLDTCIVSKFLKDDFCVSKHLERTDPNDLGISIITKLEINYGFALHPNNFQKQRKRWENFCTVVQTYPFGDSEQIAAVEIKTALHKQGKMIGSFDILIAATAQARKITCVTNNTHEFIRVSELNLVDWTQE